MPSTSTLTTLSLFHLLLLPCSEQMQQTDGCGALVWLLVFVRCRRKGCRWRCALREVKNGSHVSHSQGQEHVHPVGQKLTQAQREAYGADKAFMPTEVEEELRRLAMQDTTDGSYVRDALTYGAWKCCSCIF